MSGFWGSVWETWFRVVMILREVALLRRIQSRCDGVGSEVNGGKPSVNRALRGTLRGFLLLVTSLLWWNSRAEALHTVNAKLAGPLLPGLPNWFSAVNWRG